MDDQRRREHDDQHASTSIARKEKSKRRKRGCRAGSKRSLKRRERRERWEARLKSRHDQRHHHRDHHQRHASSGTDQGDDSSSLSSCLSSPQESEGRMVMRGADKDDARSLEHRPGADDVMIIAKAPDREAGPNDGNSLVQGIHSSSLSQAIPTQLLTDEELLQIKTTLIEQLVASESQSRIQAALESKVVAVMTSEVVIKEFDSRLKRERQALIDEMEAELLAAREGALEHSEELRGIIREREDELMRLQVEVRAAEEAWVKKKEVEAARKLEENLADVARRQRESAEEMQRGKEERERREKEQKEVLGKGGTREKLAFGLGSGSGLGSGVNKGARPLPRPFL